MHRVDAQLLGGRPPGRRRSRPAAAPSSPPTGIGVWCTSAGPYRPEIAGSRRGLDARGPLVAAERRTAGAQERDRPLGELTGVESQRVAPRGARIWCGEVRLRQPGTDRRQVAVREEDTARRRSRRPARRRTRRRRAGSWPGTARRSGRRRTAGAHRSASDRVAPARAAWPGPRARRVRRRRAARSAAPRRGHARGRTRARRRRGRSRCPLTVHTRPSGSRTIANASPPMPHCPGSTSQAIAAIASVASMALPPSASTRAPASEIAGWLELTAARDPRASVRGVASGSGATTSVAPQLAAPRTTVVDVGAASRRRSTSPSSSRTG